MGVQAIKAHVCDIITKAQPPSLPITTLTQTAAAGVGSLTLHIAPLLDSAGRSRVVEGSRARFYDGLGEIPVTVNSINNAGAVLTLETVAALGSKPAFTGLRQTHASGTPVAFNLLPYGPFDPSDMLALGDPVITVVVQRKRTYHDLQPDAGFPKYSVHIQSDMSLSRPDTSIDPESWAYHCDETTTEIIESLETLFLQPDNQELITEFSSGIAVQLGDLTGRGELTVTDLGPIRLDVSTGSIWHYVGTLDLLFLGNAEPR